MLFNFPSRYLSAIGLATVFGLKVGYHRFGLHSQTTRLGKTRSDRSKRPYGPDTRRGTGPRSKGHRRSPTIARGLPYVTTRHARKRADSTLDSSDSLAVTPESRLVSFPPLNNMLKFSGCSRLNSGRSRLSLGKPQRGRRRPARPCSPRPLPKRAVVVGHRTDNPLAGSALASRPAESPASILGTALRTDTQAGAQRPLDLAKRP